MHAQDSCCIPNKEETCILPPCVGRVQFSLLGVGEFVREMVMVSRRWLVVSWIQSDALHDWLVSLSGSNGFVF